jgi:hypothetical protein
VREAPPSGCGGAQKPSSGLSWELIGTALKFAIGGGVQGDPQHPGECFLAEFEEGYLWLALPVLTTERVVLFVCHAFCSVKSRLASLVLAPSDAAGWFDHCGYQVEVQYL